MAKAKTTGTIEWADWDRLEPVSPIPLKKAIFTPYLATQVDAELPPPPGHDHGINDLQSDPPPSSAGDDASGSRVPVYTPEWTSQRESDPGRTLTEQDAAEAPARKVSMTITGQFITPPLWNDDDDVDLGGLADFANSPENIDRDNGAALEHHAGHGILLDFEDDALNIDDVLEHAFEPGTEPDDGTTEPASVETPSDPEPPVPHAMAQFILIVGMADAPSEDPGLDDGGIAATVA